IVINGSGFDLVRAGLVTSLARPGGNITGSQILGRELDGKRLELLKELVPNLVRVALLNERVTGRDLDPGLGLGWRITAAARLLSLELHSFVAAGSQDFPALFFRMRKEGDQGLIVMATPFMFAHRRQIADLAATHRIPAIYESKEYLDAGGLMSYGPNTLATLRRTAPFVDNI